MTDNLLIAVYAFTSRILGVKGAFGSPFTTVSQLIYIYIYVCVKEQFIGYIFNKPELICLHTVKWFQPLLFIGCTQLYSFNFCY